MTRIIVRMPNWIGDFVMATPILEDLRKAYPDAFIAALVSTPFADLLDGNPFIDKIITFSRANRFFPKSGNESLLKLLRKYKFDQGILLTNSFSSAWHFLAGGVKKRTGFAIKGRSFLLTNRVPFPLHKEKQHLVETYKTLLGPSSTKPSLFIPKEEKPIGITRIGINPGAAYGSAKCWLPERFREVALALAQDIPYSEIIFFGGKDTASLIEEICRDLPSNVINLSGKTTLKELVSKIGSLDAFLTNDSGPMHIAAALEVPLVALFGSTNEIATGPYGWGEVIHKKVACSPCYKRVCPIDFRCMKRIETLEVTQAVKRALTVRPSLSPPTPFVFTEKSLPKISSLQTIYSPQKSAAIILAAGKGRRLGLDYPKGMLSIHGKSLYEILLEKGKGRPMAIMTSPSTHRQTQEFLQEKGFGHIPLFQTRVLPRLTTHYEESPEGNGALYGALAASSLLQKWHDVDRISVVPIDNPLNDPFDPRLFNPDVDLSVKAVLKEAGEEKLGALVEKEGRLFVAEYYQLPKGYANPWGYSGCFAAKKSFFEKAASLSLPWHKVERNQAFHFERFIFDAFPSATSYEVVLADRKKEFAPIKTIADLAFVERLLYTISS